MAKRRKLTREERGKRAGKRAARAQAAPLRDARRAASQVLRGARRFLHDPLTQARAVYDYACAAALLDPPEQVVCERCGLVQENHRGEVDWETGLVRVSSCQGFEGIGCGSLHAVTLESFA